MNTAQAIGYPLLIIAAFELFLGLLLLKQNPRNSPVNKATAACVFAAALWSLSSGFMYLSLSLGRDFLFFARFSWVGWFTVPTAIQTVFYLEDEQSSKARTAGWILYPFWSVVLGLCLFTDLVVTDGYLPLPYQNSPGPLEPPLRVFGSIIAFWLVWEIIRLRRRMTGVRRVRLSYYLYGTIIFSTGGGIIGGILQAFTGRGLEPSLSAYFSLPWVLLIFYAITRHRLFDIRFVLSRTLNILFLSFTISAFQFFLFRALEPVIGAVATIFISVPLIGVLFFGTPLSRTVQRWINELVLRGRYQYQSMLKESAEAMVTILDRDEVLRFTVESVRKWIGARETELFLQGGDGAYASRYSAGAQLHGFRGGVLPQTVVDCLAETGQPIVREELSEGAAGSDTDLTEAVRRVGAELLLPLIIKGRMLGVVTLSERVNGEPYLQGDIDALQTLASHAAAAIENARLFEDAVRARASQQESENIFRTLAETTAAAILILRLDRILYVNKACAFITGYGREELLTMNPWSLIHPDHRKDIYERGRSFVEGLQVPPENEFRFVTKGGEVRWVVAGTASITFQGEPAIISTMVDITDLKRAEEAKIHFFKESAKHYQEKVKEQERFQTILAKANEGFWITSEDDRFLFVNDAYLKMTGWERDELMRRSIGDVEVFEDPAMIVQHTRRIREKGHEIFETQHRRMGGAPVDLEVSVTFYPPERVFFSFFRDISERKRADEALRRSEERFRQVSETAQEWIWEVDREGKYTYASPVVSSLLGYHPDEVVGKHYFYDFFVPEDREQLKQDALKAFAERREFREFTNRNLHKDGREIVLSTSGTPILGPDGALLGYRGVDFDITERIRAERERERLYEESVSYYRALLDEQRRHQDEKEKILKDLHDGIGGITTNINLLAELAQHQEDRAAVQRSLSTIADLSRDSLSEIRTFIQSLDSRELSWQAIAAEFRHLGRAIVEAHGIQFSLDVAVPESGSVPGSAMAMSLFRIYKESLANVVKHAKATRVAAKFVVAPGSVALEVRDDGIGIGQARSGGRGLLNMRSRAEELGGTLSVNGDQGTHVVAQIPIP